MVKIKIEIAPEDVLGVKFVQQAYDFDCDPTKPVSSKEIAKIVTDLKLDASAGERTLQSKEGKWYLDDDRKFPQPPHDGEVFLIRINPTLRSRQFISSLDEDSPLLKEILFKVSVPLLSLFFFILFSSSLVARSKNKTGNYYLKLHFFFSFLVSFIGTPSPFVTNFDCHKLSLSLSRPTRAKKHNNKLPPPLDR